MIRRAFPILGVAVAIAAVSACGEPAAPEAAVPGPAVPGPSTPEPRVPSPLTVSNVTTGGAFDADGFTIAIDGKASGGMDLNETLSLWDIANGPHTVSLSGTAANCRVLDDATRSVTVVRGSSVHVRFEVTCTAAPELARLRILFVRAAGVADGKHPASLVAMNADGSGRVQLTSGTFNDYGPDVSPDGRTIAFMRDEAGGWPSPDIYTLSADGSEVALIPGPAYDPDWSPDGSRIAFSGLGSHWGGPIMVARSDGGGVTQLTGQDPMMEEAWPAWSPDGTRLAFTRAELDSTGGSTRIWLMNADGSGAHAVSPRDAWMPMWSPDGRTIVYRVWGGDTHVIHTDGSGPATLLGSATISLALDDWSADGRFMLFSRPARESSSRTDIYLLDLDTRAVTRLTADGAYNRDAVFWAGAREGGRSVRDALMP